MNMIITQNIPIEAIRCATDALKSQIIKERQTVWPDSISEMMKAGTEQKEKHLKELQSLLPPKPWKVG